MRRAEDDVQRLRMAGEDSGEGVDDVLDALVGRQEPEAFIPKWMPFALTSLEVIQMRKLLPLDKTSTQTTTL
jgi:hypothetical protein